MDQGRDAYPKASFPYFNRELYYENLLKQVEYLIVRRLGTEQDMNIKTWAGEMGILRGRIKDMSNMIEKEVDNYHQLTGLFKNRHKFGPAGGDIRPEYVDGVWRMSNGSGGFMGVGACPTPACPTPAFTAKRTRQDVSA